MGNKFSNELRRKASEDDINYALPHSLLDTDLYKFTMQQAIFRHFPDVQATYRFTHRDENVFFSSKCYERFRRTLPHFGKISVSHEEINWLKHTCPFFEQDYLDFLSSYRFKPDQIKVEFNPKDDDPSRGRIEMLATGSWLETILWEVPLMSCLSEIYFRTDDRDWSYAGQAESAYEKGKALLQAGAEFSEFGTRRRRSFHAQDIVIANLIRASHDSPGTGKLTGTSNVLLAMKHGLRPIGTIAHEWFMGVAAQGGYEGANGRALDLWEKTYPEGPLIALTDTFSTQAFFKDFASDKDRVKRWPGLRQDSGDPFAFAPLAKNMYEDAGEDYRKHSIIFSDALSVDKAIKLKQQCDEIGFKSSFGIGTNFTNDFKKLSSGGTEKSRPLNMVIKLASVDGKPCVKISDDLNKNTGDPETIRQVKTLYGLPV